MSNPNQPVSGTDVALLSTRVAALVGDLTPGPHTTSADLDKARLAVTEALVSGFQQQITAPATQPVPPPADLAVTAAIASTVEAVMQRPVAPQIVARRTSVSSIMSLPLPIGIRQHNHKRRVTRHPSLRRHAPPRRLGASPR
ncbi:MAG: hypothetical protein WCD33_21305 [Mycobacterium sp.]